jgi:hypothetical protein
MHLNSVPSEPIREEIVISSDAIKSSLTSLKNTAALTEKIPSFTPLADLLLKVLTTQDVSI